MLVTIFGLNLLAYTIVFLISIDAWFYPYADSKLSALANTVDQDAIGGAILFAFFGILFSALALLLSLSKLHQGSLTKTQKRYFSVFSVTSVVAMLYCIYRSVYLYHLSSFL
jgi:hypothetical protein